METTQVVHVVDDDSAVRDSLQFLLLSKGWNVCTYATGADLMSANLGPAGCVITDFAMPDMTGLELQERLADHGIGLPLILMTGCGDIPIAVRAMKAGAVDFLEKPFQEEQLLLALDRALAANRRTLEAEIVVEKAAQKLASLTPRELEVLDLVVMGLTNKATARALGTSPRTIDVHRARIFQKLDVNTVPDLVRLVMAGRPAERSPSSH